jgi:hypothetical protein
MSYLFSCIGNTGLWNQCWNLCIAKAWAGNNDATSEKSIKDLTNEQKCAIVLYIDSTVSTTTR